MDGDFRRIHLGEGFKRTHIPTMAAIVQCACGAEYKRTETKFLVPRTGHASCKVCGAALESWLESTHVATFELVNRPDRWHHIQMAHVLWQQRCLEVASRLHHVGDRR
jgi:hypothetical protein